MQAMVRGTIRVLKCIQSHSLILLQILCIALVVTATESSSAEPVVAIHVSETTQALETRPAVPPTPTGAGTSGYEWWYTAWHYFVAYESLKEALRSDGTPYVVVSDAEIAAGGLFYPDGSPRYPILISLASEAISDALITLLRQYVRKGGFLLAGSSAFTRNPNGTARGDFALAQEMGISMSSQSLQNWAVNTHFNKIVDHRLVSHIPDGFLAWKMPLTAEDISAGVSPDHSFQGDHFVWRVRAMDAEVLANGTSGPLLTVKNYGSGYFIYHGAFQPLVGHGNANAGMYSYMIYRKAIEWAFETADTPIVRLSPWPYPYDAALLIRHDFENLPGLIESIESSAQFEHSVGAKGDYYFCTGTLREEMGNAGSVVSSLRRAVTNSGATIGSHNGGLRNPRNPSLTISAYDYWHWGPDEALDVTPFGYPSGKAYAHESILRSFEDIEGWLAGTDNGRAGCGIANNCPRIWVSPLFNSTREDSYDIMEQLDVITMGEQKIGGPFPHYTLSYKTPGKRFSHVTMPPSEWYVGAEIVQRVEAHSTASMRSAVDFYYDLGALVNLYGHDPSDNGSVQQDYVLYSLSKPRMWSSNSVELFDWWALRSAVTVVPVYSVEGNHLVVRATVTGAADPDSAIEIALPKWQAAMAGTLQIHVNGVPANPADYRATQRGIKIRTGGAASNIEVRYPGPILTAADDAYNVALNTTLVVPAPGVLSNDTGTGISAFLVSGPSHGSLVLNADGSFSYTPAANYSGLDSFTYRGRIGIATSNVATVSIQVKSNTVPLAITATAGTGGSISPSGSVSVNLGGSQSFVVSASAGYQVADVKVDELSLGPISTYTFNNVQANHSIAATFAARQVIPKTNWRLAYVDSQEVIGENGAATNSFDNNNATMWHTRWYGGNDPLPHEIQIDMGSTYAVSGFRYLPRQDGGVNGRIGQYEFYVSADGMIWGPAVAAGVFADNALEKEAAFAPKVGRFIRLRALTEVNGNPWTVVAEITALGIGTANPTHTITATAGTGGSITPSGSVTVTSGGSRTFTIAAAAGYKIADVKVDGTSVGAVATYTFNNVTANRTIAATFAALPATYTITATAGTGGSITPSGAVTVAQGASQTFTIAASSGYRIADVKVNGASVGAVSTYTFSNVTANHTISATFAVNTSQPLAVASVTSGSINSGSSMTISHTTSGSGRVMLVGVSLRPRYSNYSVSGVSYNGAALTRVGTVARSDDARVEIWGLIAPAVGTANVVITFDRTVYYGAVAGVVTFTGAHQTTPLGSFVSANGDSSTAGVNVPSAAGEMVFGVVDARTSSSLTQGSAQTERWDLTAASGNTHGAGSTQPGATSVTTSWSLGSSANWAIATVSVKPADAASQPVITATAGTGGSITPSGAVTVAQGASQTFTIVASSGYRIADVKVNGASVGAVSTYTFSNVIANHTIAATFAAIPTYTITATAGTGGSIAPSGAVTVAQGASQTFTIAASSGYRIADVKVNGASVGAVSTYTFSNVTANHTIAATFAAIPTYTITATAGPGGSIAPSGTVAVNSGGSQTFQISPSVGYRIADVKVDGVSVGAVSAYTFSNVSANRTIQALFALQTFTITATAGTGGSITPSGVVTVNYGGSITFTITPNQGYEIADVKVNGVSMGPLSTLTLSAVNANHAIEAAFSPVGAPDIRVSSTSLSFGFVRLGKTSSRNLTISNAGTSNLVVSLVGIEGSDASSFSTDFPGAQTIPPSGSFKLKVTFEPTSRGLKSATLRITSNDPDTPAISVSLGGVAY